jgi:hypothetical protein
MNNTAQKEEDMSNAAKSVFVFGIYEVVLGALVMIMPNTLLAVLGFPRSDEIWIRVTGMLVCVFAFYDIQAARTELTDYFRWTVFTRSLVIIFFIAFVMSGLVIPELIILGVMDLLGAIWTGLALWSSKSPDHQALTDNKTTKIVTGKNRFHPVKQNGESLPA